jgi:hypothetical protein
LVSGNDLPPSDRLGGKNARGGYHHSSWFSLFAISTGAIAQDMNGMNGNSMGQGTMTHKPMTKKQRTMMQKQQMMKKRQMMQHNM